MGASTKVRSLFTGVKRVLAVLAVTLVSLVSLHAFALAEDSPDYTFNAFTDFSTYTKGAPLTDSYYYTDDWFSAAPEEQNDALALISMQLVASGAKDDGASGTNGSTVLQSLGFEQAGFKAFDNGSTAVCGYTWGTKTIQDDSGSCTLVAIVIQSYSTDPALKMRGWQQNFTINGDSAEDCEGVQYSYEQEAALLLDSVASLGGSGNVKYWICGQSQGGAVANVLSARLADKLGSLGADIYAYTFESPATIDASLASDGYDFIHNYLTSDDIVARVPLWDMTRYGVTHKLDGGTSDELVAELKKLGSDAAEAEYGDYEEQMGELIAYLGERIPTRAAYSALNTDTFTDESGAEVVINYSYQTTFRNLMSLIFGGEVEGLDLDAISGDIEELAPTLYTFVDAVANEKAGLANEAATDYWTAALGLREELDSFSATGSVTLDDADVYALLRLIGPIAVNTEFEPYEDAMSNALGYLSPLVGIAMNASNMVYSHHFDTVIARLKLLAPQPELGAIDIAIDVPVAGDANGKAPGEVAAFIDSLGNSWLTSDASWNTTVETLEDGSVVYLTVTLSAVGHLTTENTVITINGEKPVTAYTLSHEDGAGIVSATWKYTIGEPEAIAVSFDARGLADNPASIEVQKGSSLAYADTPEFVDTVTIDGTTWRFDGWYGDDGTPWAELTVNEPITVYAKWVQVVDHVDITFTIPELGEAFTAPTAPEDAPYYVSEWYVVDGTWDDAETAEWGTDYHVGVNVSLKDPDSAEFALDATYYEEWDYTEYSYLGAFAVNGAEVEASYDEGGFYLRSSFDLAFYRFTEGDGQTWTKGSGESAVFTVERSHEDEDEGAFDYFTGISIDGEAVDPSLYTAEAGSVHLTLSLALLETLDVGEHTLTAEFEDGSADATFTVEAPEDEPTPGNDTPADTKPADTTPASGPSSGTPKSGDESRTAWAALAPVAMLALAGGVLLRKWEHYRFE